ncbi:MAG: LytR/AlgR family response regulator transcription factor [Bryobacteraceae bacterium]
MRVLIADDEPVARQILRELAAECPGVEVAGEAADGPAAVEQVAALDPDVVLLDLQMPGLDGFAVARQLRGRPLPLVIYVTAFDSHALEAFETGAVDYLLKPVRRERLERAFRRAHVLLDTLRPASGPSPGAPAIPPPKLEPPRRIAARSGPSGTRSEAELHLLDPAEILAIQAREEVVLLLTARGRYYCDLSLKALAARLPAPPFRRIHRSTIVNTDHIRTIVPLTSRRWMLRMSNGLEVVVSRRMASQVRESAGW